MLNRVQLFVTPWTVAHQAPLSMGFSGQRMLERVAIWRLCQTLGDGDGQGSLACCSPWGRQEPDTTERLNNPNKRWGERIRCENDPGCWQRPVGSRDETPDSPPMLRIIIISLWHVEIQFYWIIVTVLFFFFCILMFSCMCLFMRPCWVLDVACERFRRGR